MIQLVCRSLFSFAEFLIRRTCKTTRLCRGVEVDMKWPCGVRFLECNAALGWQLSCVKCMCMSMCTPSIPKQSQGHTCWAGLVSTLDSSTSILYAPTTPPTRVPAVCIRVDKRPHLMAPRRVCRPACRMVPRGPRTAGAQEHSCKLGRNCAPMAKYGPKSGNWRGAGQEQRAFGNERGQRSRVAHRKREAA